MNRPHAHGDFETRSAVDLKTAGAFKHSRDPSTDVWCFAWCIGDEEPELWTPENPGSVFRLFNHIAAGGIFVAHNAPFELSIWNNLMRPRYGWPALPIPQTRCTMAQAMALSLPGALALLARVVGAPQAKDAEGSKNMKRMAKPRARWTAREWAEAWASWKPKRRDAIDLTDRNLWTVLADGSVIQWWGDADRLAAQYAYCLQDVRTERAVEARIMPLSDTEQRLWELDRVINTRGFKVDPVLIYAALDVVNDELRRLDHEIAVATLGAVQTCSQAKQLAIWIREQGAECAGVAAPDVAEMLLRPELPGDFVIGGVVEVAGRVRRALELRQRAALSSTAKLKAAILAADDDWRIRDCMQFNGANTARWAGRRFQPHNMPRPDMKQNAIDFAIGFLRDNAPGSLGHVNLEEIENEA